MKNKRRFIFIFLMIMSLTYTPAYGVQDYDKLKQKLLNNFPSVFEGKTIHPRTYSLGIAIINQISEDLRKIKFDEETAIWLHASDYILYDANTAKKIGNTYYIAYKTEDNKVLGTYVMNCENPANNRLIHTSYNISGGNYTIKEKITLHNFSHLVCQNHQKRLQRF